MSESHGTHDEQQVPEKYWDERYAERDQIWSGNPNQALVDTVGNLPAGRAFDLGCGEGGDAIWLAEQGWRVMAVDIASRAVVRAQAAAESRGIAPGQIEWVVADLSTASPSPIFDLVSACFFHSTVELPRGDILRRVAGGVAPGGHLLIVGHAEAPPWSDAHAHDHRDFLTPQQEIEQLALPGGEWETVVAETRTRQATAPDGDSAELRDQVLLLRRR